MSHTVSELRRGLQLRPFRVTINVAKELRDAYEDGYVLRLAMTVADRDTGVDIPLHFGQTLPGVMDHQMSDEDHRAWVRRAIVQFLAHEVDELLLLNGQRNDPHKGEYP